MQVYDEYFPSSSTEHAIEAKLGFPANNCLVLAKGQFVEVYDYREKSRDYKAYGPEDDSKNINNNGHSNQSTICLHLLCRFRAFGVVTGACCVKAKGKRGSDLVLVSFERAKAALLQWDDVLFNFEAIHIYSFEHVQFQPGFSSSSANLIADSEGQCAIMMFSNDLLAVISFTSDENNGESGMYQADELQSVSSFVLTASQLNEFICGIIDIVFLNGYHEPTIAVLYGESHQLDTSTPTAREDTKSSVLVITLDISARASTTIVAIEALPSDIFRLKDLPISVGGFLMIGCNEIFIADQSGKLHAVAANSFALNTKDFTFKNSPVLEADLTGCCVDVFDGKGNALVATQSGDSFVLEISFEGRLVNGLKLHRISLPTSQLFSWQPSCLLFCRASILFLGNSKGDSFLFRLHSEISTIQHRGHEESLTSQDGELESIYGSKSSLRAVENGNDLIFHIEEIDRIKSLSSSVDSALGPNQQANAPKVEIASVGGSDMSGTLTVVRSSTPFKVLSSVSLQGPCRVFTAKLRKTPTKGTGWCELIFLSGDHQTGIFCVQGGFEEVVGTEFRRDQCSLYVAAMNEGRVIVQVCESVMCMYEHGKLPLTHPISNERRDETAALSTVSC